MLESRREFLNLCGAAGMAALLPVTGFADEKARKGGHVRMAIQNGSLADTLDPAKGIHSGDFTKQFCIFNALTEFDDTLKPGYALAETIESADGLTWHIAIKKGIHFHDGAELSSADVVFSLARHKNPETVSKVFALAKNFKEVSATGKYTVTLQLERADFDFPSVLGSSFFLIVKDGTRDFARPVGTGPFIVDRFVPGGPFSAKRNPNYWKSGLPHLDSVEIIGVPDSPARVNAVLAGDIDICSLVDHKYAAQVKASPDVTLVVNKLGIYTDLVLRSDNPVTGNADFVSAMRYLQDRDRLVSTAMQGYGVVANDQPVAPWDPYFLQGLPQTSFDLDKARYFIKKSGLAGQSMEIVCQPGIASAVEGAQWIQSYGAQAGFNFVVKQVPTEGYWANYWTKRPITYGSVTNRPTAGMIFDVYYSSQSPLNEAHWRSPRVDELLASARAEPDFKKRKAIYGDLQTFVHANSGTVIPVFDVILDGVSKTVRGYRTKPSGMNMGFRFAEYVWRA